MSKEFEVQWKGMGFDHSVNNGRASEAKKRICNEEIEVNRGGGIVFRKGIMSLGGSSVKWGGVEWGSRAVCVTGRRACGW